jgi:hypothetical protein
VTFQKAVLAFLGVEDIGSSGSGKQGTQRGQKLGEYCKGSDIEECKGYFGDGVLPRICETCPD